MEEKAHLRNVDRYGAVTLPEPGSQGQTTSSRLTQRLRSCRQRILNLTRIAVTALCAYALLVQMNRIVQHGRSSHPHHRHDGGLKRENETDFSRADRGAITWFRCDDDKKYPPPFRCGRLKAPLDYTTESDRRNASIALVFYPAGGGQTQESRVIGSLLVNPGGPGGSGIDLLTRRPRGFNQTIAEQFDKVLRHRYNIVSFDPRGVQRTLPRIDCFQNDANGHLYAVQTDAYGEPLSHVGGLDSELGVQMARNTLVANLCASQQEQRELLRHVGTVAVCRDMKLLYTALGDDKISYWGFSYGSVLGSTFADLFPDEIHRLAIDGVVDVPNYYQGLWNDFFTDIEAEFDLFFQECAKAGPQDCKLASHSTDGKVLRQLYLDLLERLKVRPMAAYSAKVPQLATFSQVHREFFQSLYVPNRWGELASLLDSMLRDDPNPFIDLHGSTPFEPPPTPSSPFAQAAIACGDVLTATSNHTWTLDEYKRFLTPVQAISPHFATFFATIAHACLSEWKVRSSERHYGDFTSSTSFPLLLLGNDYDPVTPGSNADLMAAKFARAVAVRRSGYGHCSISMPSRCINRVLREYFVEGKVPRKGSRCEVDADKPIFPGPKPVSEQQMQSWSQEQWEEEEDSLAFQAIGHAIAEMNQRNGHLGRP